MNKLNESGNDQAIAANPQTAPHRRPYQKPTLQSEPLFESVASGLGKNTLIDPLCLDHSDS